jgi:phosphoribosyl 1,2-cyclic phosphodiesterase
VRITVLASGSSGNATVFEAGGTRLLVDAGLSYRQLQRRLHEVDLHVRDLGAVVISHEHSDHVQGLEVLVRHLQGPVLATAGSAAALDPRFGVEGTLFDGREVRLGAFAVTPVATRHDAAEPVGFIVRHGDCRVGLATDTGCVGEELLEAFAGCRALLLESNHDPDLLRVGPYPWPLKARIAADTGHLSNAQAQRAVERLCHPGLEVVVGMHLSRENNRPELAGRELARPLEGSGVRVAVADQVRPLLIELAAAGPGQRSLFEGARQTRVGWAAELFARA